jgi:hypothetical protein
LKLPPEGSRWQTVGSPAPSDSMLPRRLPLLIVALTLQVAPAIAQSAPGPDGADGEIVWPVFPEWGWSSDRPDGRGPIGVGFDDGVGAGEWRLDYRLMSTRHSGMRSGSSGVSTADVFGAGYSLAPTKLTVTAHVFEGRFGLSDRVTLAGRVPFYDKSMDLETTTGSVTLDSSGVGDLELGALYKADAWGLEKVYLSSFASIPTGSFDQRGGIPGLGSNAVLPYALQLGDGGFDLRPGVLILGQEGKYSWGFLAEHVFHITDNDQNYRLGGRTEGSWWLARRLGGRLSTSLRLGFLDQANIHGSDERMDPTTNPAADADRQAAQRFDIAAGLNFQVGATGRAGIELGIPFYQHLKGPQPEADFFFGLGLQFGF